MRRQIIQSAAPVLALMLLTIGYTGTAQARGQSDRESRMERESQMEMEQGHQQFRGEQRESKRSQWRQVSGEIERAK